MIVLAVVIIAIVVVVAIQGSVGERRRRPAELRRSPRRSGPSQAGLPEPPADWWEEFERQFRLYARRHQREAR